jgi:hypothetical protein
MLLQHVDYFKLKTIEEKQIELRLSTVTALD